MLSPDFKAKSLRRPHDYEFASSVLKLWIPWSLLADVKLLNRCGSIRMNSLESEVCSAALCQSAIWPGLVGVWPTGGQHALWGDRVIMGVVVNGKCVYLHWKGLRLRLKLEELRNSELLVTFERDWRWSLLDCNGPWKLFIGQVSKTHPLHLSWHSHLVQLSDHESPGLHAALPSANATCAGA